MKINKHLLIVLLISISANLLAQQNMTTHNLPDIEIKTTPYTYKTLKRDQLYSSSTEPSAVFQFQNEGFGGEIVSFDDENASYIKNKQYSNAQIIDFSFFVHPNSNLKQRLLLRFYSVDPDKEIPQQLLTTQKVQLKIGWNTVKLKNKTAFPIGGCYVSFEMEIDHTFDKEKYYDYQYKILKSVSKGMVALNPLGIYINTVYQAKKRRRAFKSKNSKWFRSDLKTRMSLFGYRMNIRYEKNFLGIKRNEKRLNTKKAVDKKIVVPKRDGKIYPQNDVVNLLNSCKKAVQNNQLNYLFAHLLYFGKNDQASFQADLFDETGQIRQLNEQKKNELAQLFQQLKTRYIQNGIVQLSKNKYKLYCSTTENVTIYHKHKHWFIAPATETLFLY